MSEERQPNTELRAREFANEMIPPSKGNADVVDRKIAVETLTLKLMAFAASIQAEAQQQIEELTKDRDTFTDQLRNALGAPTDRKWFNVGLLEVAKNLRAKRDAQIVVTANEVMRADEAEKQLAEARAHLFEFHHCNCEEK